MEAEDTSPTTEAWLDQLPREVVDIIVEHLARAGVPDIKNDRGASFTAYQGYVGMSVMNRALHAALPVQRSVEVVIRSPIMWCNAKRSGGRCGHHSSHCYQTWASQNATTLMLF